MPPRFISVADPTRCVLCFALFASGGILSCSCRLEMTNGLLVPHQPLLCRVTIFLVEKTKQNVSVPVSCSFLFMRVVHCMQVHGDMHGLLGGAFNCGVDFGDFQANNPQFSPGLLTFVLEYLTTNFWPDNSMMGEYNECDTGCSKGDKDCGCTCLIDPMSMSSDEVRRDPYLSMSIVVIMEHFAPPFPS